ncbi:MAG: RdgB/HAM1 family non-canonical purine NTP pyrophosphatase [Clostridia bacterium]|nr:RdgB/HAM1 family non-canonical purine NTP pyrophosphatase [Clostridia bacterium]
MLIVATGNEDKMREMRRILSKYSLISMREAGIEAEIEENGQSFAENALIKAREICRLSGKETIADDSGLVVEALGGAPGIYSARYGGENTSYPEKMHKLLTEIAATGDQERKASYVCVIAYVTPGGEEYTFEGVCNGRIGFAPCGTNGFGYDPLFISEDTGRTFAEMEAQEKDKYSHRTRALEKLHAFLKKKGSSHSATF